MDNGGDDDEINTHTHRERHTQTQHTNKVNKGFDNQLTNQQTLIFMKGIDRT